MTTTLCQSSKARRKRKERERETERQRERQREGRMGAQMGGERERKKQLTVDFQAMKKERVKSKNERK